MIRGLSQTVTPPKVESLPVRHKSTSSSYEIDSFSLAWITKRVQLCEPRCVSQTVLSVTGAKIGATRIDPLGPDRVVTLLVSGTYAVQGATPHVLVCEPEEVPQGSPIGSELAEQLLFG